MKKDNNTLAIVLIVILALLLFGGFRFGMMGGAYYGLSFVFNVLIIILIIAGAYWIIKKIKLNERR